MNKRLKILWAVALVITIVGAVMAYTLGINKGLEYNEHTELIIYMSGESELDDVKDIIEEVTDGKYKVSYTDDFKDTVHGVIEKLEDDQIKELEDRLQEEYQFDNTDQKHINIMNASRVRSYTLVRDYIKPVIISFVLVIAYNAIVFRKQGILKLLIEQAISIILINTAVIGAIIISRIPVNIYVISVEVFVYIISLVLSTICLNRSKEAEKNS